MNSEMRDYLNAHMNDYFDNPFNPYGLKGKNEPFWAMLMVPDYLGCCEEPYGSYRTFADAMRAVERCDAEMREHPLMYEPYTLLLCRMTSKGKVDNRCNYYRFHIE